MEREVQLLVAKSPTIQTMLHSYSCTNTSYIQHNIDQSGLYCVSHLPFLVTKIFSYDVTIHIIGYDMLFTLSFSLSQCPRGHIGNGTQCSMDSDSDGIPDTALTSGCSKPGSIQCKAVSTLKLCTTAH